MIFKNQQQEEEFSRIGYLIIPNFLDKGIIEDLLNYHIEFDNFIDTGFKTSVWSSNFEYRTKTFNLLKPIYEKGLESILIDYEPIMGNYMIKEPVENSALDIHADWQFTNEEKHTAINAWTPLVDTTEENGCLRILPYSNHFNYPFRGRGIPHQFENIKEYMQTKTVPIEVNAGDLVLFNVKCIHFSENNRSRKRRPAISMVMAPKVADKFHFTAAPNNQVRKIKIDNPIFYCTYNAFEEIPPQKNETLIPFERKQFDKSFFDEIYTIAKPDNSLKKWWLKLRGKDKIIL